MIKSRFYTILLILLVVLISCERSYEEEQDNTVIGEITVDLNVTSEYIRVQESEAGNLIADSFKNYLGDSVDFTFLNAGGIRYDEEKRVDGIYPAGDFTLATIKELLPFDNEAVVVEITGAELKQILERSVAGLPSADGKFLQVSSELKFQVDRSRQAQILDSEGETIEIAGERVTSILINNSVYDPLKTYKVGTVSYIANGGDDYVIFANISPLKKSGMGFDVRDTLIDYIRYNTPITPELDGRIELVE